MNFDPSTITPDEDAAVRAVIGEAGGEPPIGQQAVAGVIANRAKIGKLPFGQVVAEPGQFQAWNSPKVQSIDSSDPQYIKIAQTIIPVLRGQAPNPVGGATHYLNPDLQAKNGDAPPAWAQGQGTRIGNHVFYENVGYAGHGSAPTRINEETGETEGSDPTATPATPVAETTGPGAPEMPGVADRQGLAGDVTPTSPVASTQTAPANTKSEIIEKAVEENAQTNPFWKYGMGALVPANSTLAGFLPEIQAGLMAGGTGLNNFAAENGLFGAQKTPYGMADMYNGAKLGIQHTFDQYAQDHPKVNAAGTVLGAVNPIGADALIAKGVTAGAEKLAPQIPGVVGRVAGMAGAGALNGVGTGTSRGEDATQVAQEAGTSGALAGILGGGVEGAGAVGSKLLSPAFRNSSLPVGMGALGGGFGALINHENPAAGFEYGAGLGHLAGQGAANLFEKFAPTSEQDFKSAAIELLNKEIAKSGKNPDDIFAALNKSSNKNPIPTGDVLGKYIDSILKTTEPSLQQNLLGAAVGGALSRDFGGAVAGSVLSPAASEVKSVLTGTPTLTRGVRSALEDLRDQPGHITAGDIGNHDYNQDLHLGEDSSNAAKKALPMTAGLTATSAQATTNNFRKPTITVGAAEVTPKQPVDPNLPEPWKEGPQRIVLLKDGTTFLTTPDGLRKYHERMGIK